MGAMRIVLWTVPEVGRAGKQQGSREVPRPPQVVRARVAGAHALPAGQFF
jgi:hypothetical protein